MPYKAFNQCSTPPCDEQCAYPPCDGPWWVADAVYNSRSKCSYGGEFNPRQGPDGNWYIAYSLDNGNHWISGSSSVDGPYHFYRDFMDTYYGPIFGEGPDDKYLGYTHVWFTDDDCHMDGESFDKDGNPASSSPSSFSHQDISISDEYTTAQLISNTLGGLPAWPDTWNDSPVAYRNLSPDEFSLSVKSIKCKLKHYPTGTCYLKVWIDKVFTPKNPDGTDGTPEVTPVEPYVWDVGAPGLSDPSKAYTDESNIVDDMPEIEVDAPDTNGRVELTIRKFTCLRNYEPPDDGSKNGFPGVVPYNPLA